MTRYDFLLLSKYVQIYIIFHLELLFWRRKQIWDNFWSSCLFASVKIYPHIEYNFLQKLWENYMIEKLIKWTTMYFTITTTLNAKCKTLHCAIQSKLIFYKIHRLLNWKIVLFMIYYLIQMKCIFWDLLKEFNLKRRDFSCAIWTLTQN